MIEGKEISYGMANPEKTFALETLMMIIATIAFYAACNVKFNISGEKLRQGFIRCAFNSLGFFDMCHPSVFWLLGLIGVIARIQTYYISAYFDVGIIGKILNAFVDSLYVPVLLFFPGILYGYEPANKKSRGK